MADVPDDTPDTTPDDTSIVAVDVLLLLQVPPVVASLSVVVDPAHTLVVPVIGVVDEFTVTVVVT